MKTFLRAALVAALLAPLPAFAQPEVMPIQGVLMDATGYPIDANALPVSFSLYRAETGGAAFFSEVAVLDVETGRFDYYLGLTEALDLGDFDGSDVWVGISVNFEPELTPRIPLGTVAYAAYAGQVRWADITGVPADIADGDNDTTYTGAPPISVTGGTISLSNVGCAAGETWVWNGSSWACTAPTPFGIGTGLTIAGGQLQVDTTIQRRLTANCPAGQYLQGFTQTGTPVCQTDVGGTSYTANNGVVLTGTTFSADVNFVQRRVSGGPCTFGIASVNSDGSVNCAANNNTNTTYTAGNGITISGAGNAIAADLSVVQARLATTSCPNGIQSISATGAITCAGAPSVPTYTANNGVVLSGTTFSADTAFVQRRVTGTCANGINSISATGTVTCAPAGASIAGGTCGARQYMYGLTTAGAPLCRSIQNDVEHFASSYIRNQCVIWIGWSDSNRFCCDRITHGGLTGTGGRSAALTTSRWQNRFDWENLQLSGFQTNGDVDNNDWFYIGLHCPQIN